MNTVEMKELNPEEMAQASGGLDWDTFWTIVQDFLKKPQPGFGA